MKIFATIGLVLAVSDLCAFADTAVRTGEQAVLSAYKSMEEADRKGDGQLWLSLRGRKTVEGMNQALRDAIRKGGRTRPNVQYLPLAVRAVRDRAVILGKVSDPDAKTEQYEAVQFAIEDGAWKVTSEQWGEKPFDPFVMYALLEPEDGAFARAGSRWKLIPYASPNPDIVKKDEVIWGIHRSHSSPGFQDQARNRQGRQDWRSGAPSAHPDQSIFPFARNSERVLHIRKRSASHNRDHGRPRKDCNHLFRQLRALREECQWRAGV